jgi:type I thyroxine 5'-deiodinase
MVEDFPEVNFMTVYIAEAHTTDEWQLPVNVEEGVCYRQPQTINERLEIARDFVQRYNYPTRLVVDNIYNSVEEDYSAYPERLYVIADDMIAYKGKPGPFGFDLAELREFLNEQRGKVTTV